jgi:hypothetical protein
MKDDCAPTGETPARAKLPLRPSHVWLIRTKLLMKGLKRDLALFNLAIVSKSARLRRCCRPGR